jgi:arachidonate 15-lipoxygenase
MAKNVVNVADSNYQEMVAHLSHTHLVAEAFVIATHRQLSKNHPLYALLTPHFEGTAFINWAAQEFLIADGNSVDILFAGTIESSRKLAVDALKSFDFNQQMLPEQLKQRGVLSDRLYFPYRDDGLVLWGAILAWVEDYIQLYYHSDDDIKNDAELQGWAAEISAEAGGRIKGFGEGEEGVILTRSYLSSALTMIIYTCSVQHAAVNFTQQTIMSFTPAMPLAGYAPEPKSRSQSKKAWLAQFPPLEMANQQLALMESLGVYYTRLGQYPHHQFKDPAVAPLLQQFQQELQRIEGIIRTRNAEDVAEEVLPYDTLVPSAIPQSINI